jgi:hypothetical protein
VLLFINIADSKNEANDSSSGNSIKSLANWHCVSDDEDKYKSLNGHHSQSYITSHTHVGAASGGGNMGVFLCRTSFFHQVLYTVYTPCDVPFY